MDYKNIKTELLKMQETNYRAFIKAIISIELDIDNENSLDKIYERFMEDDSIELLNESFREISKL